MSVGVEHGDGSRTASSERIRDLETRLAEKQATVDVLMQGFIAADFPTVDGLSFDVVYQPAGDAEQLAGDWYDVFTLPDGRVAFSLGDVCGKGMAAAVKMAQAKQAIKVAASLPANDPMPISVLRQANKVIFLNDHHVEFTTAVYGIIDVNSRNVTYACAGHHPPILACAGAASRVLPNHGFPLGIEGDLPDLIREHQFPYEPGMLLVLYTDGLTEFSHDADEGDQRLLAASREAVDVGATTPATYIAANVLRASPHPRDDVTVLTVLFS